MPRTSPRLGRFGGVPQPPMGVKGRHFDSHFALSIALAPLRLLTFTATSLAQSTVDKLRQHDTELEAIRSQQRQTVSSWHSPRSLVDPSSCGGSTNSATERIV